MSKLKLGSFNGETKPLIELCERIVDCNHSTPKWTPNGKLVIRNFNIKKGQLILTDLSYTDEQNFKLRIGRSKPESGDLIITREAPMGEVCIIPNGLECCLGQRMVLLKPNHKKVYNKYLLYAIQSEFVQKQIQQSDKTGSIVSNLRIPVLEELKIPVFGLQIEKNIGTFLDKIDSKITLNNRINTELEAMVKTIYDYWFVQFDFPDANGKPYKSSGGKMVWNKELKREIPEGWEVIPLFEAMDVQYGFPFSTTLFTNEITDKPVIRIRDILENTISTYTTEVVEAKYMLLKNDLLIGMDGNFHLNFWDKDGAYLNQRSVRIRSKNESKISNLQVYFELTPHIKAREKNVSRTTVGHLSDKDLKRLYVLSPSENGLFKPKATFDSLLNKITSNKLQNQQLSTLRDWLLPMLMNGQVKVADLDKEPLVYLVNGNRVDMVAEP